MADEPDEWGLVELQEKLETREDLGFDGLHIGDLHFDEKGTPQLIIGHHLLTGKVSRLERPFAVLQKVAGVRRTDGPEDVDMRDASGDSRSAAAGKAQSTEYLAKVFVRRKIIFKVRPKPIVRKVAVRK